MLHNNGTVDIGNLAKQANQFDQIGDAYMGYVY